MKISKDEALEILDGNRGKIISDEIVDNSRWSIIHEIIVSLEGKFYQANYSVGATESQDESPWEYENEVEFFEVEPKQVMVTQYVRIAEVV